MSDYPNQWRSNREKLFTSFLRGIENWSRTGQEPKEGDQDVRYYLDLQEHRLKDRRITMEYRFPQGSLPVTQAGKVLGGAVNPYGHSLHFSSCCETVSFSRDGTKLYSKERDVTFYQTIIEPQAGMEHLAEQTYVCPNCAAIAHIGELLDTGCPYCGTRYIMSDLYPKVTNFYTLESMPDGEKVEKETHRRVVIGAVVMAAVVVLLNLKDLFADDFYGPIALIFPTLMGAALGAFFGYISYSFTLLGKLFHQAGKSMPVLTGTFGARKKLTESIQRFDPSFSYEYFEGKALSLFRIVAFSSAPESFVQYEGGPLNGLFSNLVDSAYRGGIGIDSLRVEGESLIAQVRLYLTNYYDTGKRVERKDEVIHMRLRHKAAWKVEPGFSIVKVTCHGCGGSFDATRQRTCPYCGAEYDSEREDWMVTGIAK